MKKVFLLAGLFLATMGANAQTDTTDPGVEIKGTIWATRNVDEAGKFAATPEDNGMLYQWNRKIACSPVDMSGWDENWTVYYPTTWQTANDPCPTGWRVPTKQEVLDLFSLPSTSTSNGIEFTLGDKVVFLPMTDMILNGGSIFSDMGAYWSSTYEGSGSGYVERFGIQWFNIYGYSGIFHSAGPVFGHSIRCVCASGDCGSGSTALGDITANGRTVTGYYSTLGQPLADEPASGLFIVIYDNGKAEKRMK